MMLSRFREALEDSQQAVRLDDCFMKVRLSVVCVSDVPIILVTTLNMEVKVLTLS